MFSRSPDRFIHPQFWAEDGVVFFLESRTNGWSAIFRPVAGYLLLVPRLIASIANGFDPSHGPAIYNYLTVAITLFVIARLFSPRLPLPCKPLLGIAIAAAPHNGEILVNLTNVQWYLALLLVFQLLMADPVTLRQKFGDALTIIFAGLSGPFSVLLLPCFLLRAVIRRNRNAAFVAFLMALAAIVQADVMLSRAPAASSLNLSATERGGQLLSVFRLEGDVAATPFGGWEALLSVLGRKTVWYSFAGDRKPPGDHARLVTLISGMLFLSILFVRSLRRLAWREQKLWLWMAMGCLVFGVIVRMRPDLFNFNDNYSGDRYFFLPRLLLLWLLIIELEPLRFFKSWRDLRMTTGAPVFAVVILIVWGFIANMSRHFFVPPLQDFKWGEYSDSIRNRHAIDIPINPPGWIIHFPGNSEKP